MQNMVCNSVQKEGSKNMSKKKDEKSKNKKLWIYLISLVLLLALLVGLAIVFMNQKDKKDENTLAYTDLIKEINDGTVSER